MNNSWAYLDRNDNDRDWQRTDTIYVTPEGFAFFSPHGDSRIWFDSEKEALEETGLSHVHYFDE